MSPAPSRFPVLKDKNEKLGLRDDMCQISYLWPVPSGQRYKYGNCCEKEGQLLSVGVVYYLRVISDFPW